MTTRSAGVTIAHRRARFIRSEYLHSEPQKGDARKLFALVAVMAVLMVAGWVVA